MEYIPAIIVLVIIGALVAGAIVSVVRNKKKGRSTCGCSCSECAMHCKCHEINTDSKN